MRINITVKLLAIIFATFLFGKYIPREIASGLLAFSYTIKEIIVFFLPVIIFSCILSCMLALKSRAITFVALIFAFVSISNFSLTIISYYVTRISFDWFSIQMNYSSGAVDGLEPLWTFSLCKWIPNGIALLLGLLTGSVCTIKPNAFVERNAAFLKQMVDIFLQKLFLPILPVFILGFLLKLEVEGVLSVIVQSYLPIVMILLGTFITVITVFYMVLAKGNISTFCRYLRNALPAGLVGFSTMSSIAAMPVNLVSVANNTNNSQTAAAAVPAVVNIHLMGDSLGIPILAMAVMVTFGMPLPDLSTYVFFSFFFMLAKFATAAVPGGTILIMLPVLEKYLGFSAEMSGLIMALYMLVDPFVTATSVFGNSAFAILVSKLFESKNV